jgi:hypothetical protein
MMAPTQASPTSTTRLLQITGIDKTNQSTSCIGPFRFRLCSVGFRLFAEGIAVFRVNHLNSIAAKLASLKRLLIADNP